MTREELEEIKARAEAATPPPWKVVTSVGGQGRYGWSVPPVALDNEYDVFVNREDAEFIAHSRTDIPKLLAEVERLQGELWEINHRWRDE